MIFDSIYNKGYEAGVNAQKCADHEDQNRRLQEMFQYGKSTGYTEGWQKGYTAGHEVGYSEGEEDAKCSMGVVDLDGALEALMGKDECRTD